MKCLVADNDHVSRMVLKKLLERTFWSFGTDFYSNGDDVAQAFMEAHRQREPYHLICMDIMLPCTDGLTALQRIRVIEQELNVPPDRQAKVIITTALNSCDDAMKCGANAYLRKPVFKEQLLAELQTLCAV